MNRRAFLKASSLALPGACLTLTGCGGGSISSTARRSTLPVSDIQKFRDPLPILPKANAQNLADGSGAIKLMMSQFQQTLHSQLPPTTVWGYGGGYPGPTIDVQRGRTLRVTWDNQLPMTHLLPVDTGLHGAMPPNPAVRAVTHLHGGNVASEYDGLPEAWTVPGESVEYIYPNNQPAATMWYHDHAMGITRLNIAAGLSGIYLIRDSEEQALGLPSGEYEIPLMIHDRMLQDDGSLHYPVADGASPASHDGGEGIWIPEYIGDLAVLNGIIWPYLEVEPGRYRFRIVNGANARFYRLEFSNGAPFTLVGTDGGLLPKPVTVNSVLLAPAERADIVVDFSASAERTFELINTAPAPFPRGLDFLHYLMQIRVTKPLGGSQLFPVPSWTIPVESLSENDAVRVRDIVLMEELDENMMPVRLLLNSMGYHDPATEEPNLGDVEVWRLINPTEDTHPIHLHLSPFQVLDRQPFNVFRFAQNQTIEFTAPAMAPTPSEGGWKDTVQASAGHVTRILVRFEGFRGKYVYHCHMLEHEDNDMMRPLIVR